MISAVCAVICVVLVVLNICEKLSLGQTKGQVLLNLFALLGTANPLSVMCISDWLFDVGFVHSSEFRQDVILTQGAPAWLVLTGAVVCYLTWVYTTMRTAAGTPIVMPQEAPIQAAKRHLTMTWISLPFFLLMLVACVAYLVYALGMLSGLAFVALLMAVVFLPILIMGAWVFGVMSLWMFLASIPFLLALLIPYITGVFHSNRYLLATASCIGWKKPFRIFLQVVLFLPWLRWIVICCCMGKMQTMQKRVAVTS